MWNQDKFQKALHFVALAHLEQEWGGQYPYIVHLMSVASEVMNSLFVEPIEETDTLVVSALLHDCLEDTPVNVQEIENEFGPEVLNVVKALTKNKEIERSMRMQDSLERIKQQGSIAAKIKLADRISNLQSPPKHWNKEKCAEYLKEAELIYEQLHIYSKYLGDRLSLKIKEYDQYL